MLEKIEKICWILAARSRQSAGKEDHGSDGKPAGNGLEDYKSIGAVIGGSAQQCEQGTGPQPALQERDILHVDIVRKLRVPAAEVPAEPEQLQLLGALLAGSKIAQVVELPAGRASAAYSVHSPGRRNGFRPGKRGSLPR